MTKIIFATGNKDKLREIKEILSDCDVDIRSMNEAGINVAIVEDGKIFEADELVFLNVYQPNFIGERNNEMLA